MMKKIENKFEIGERIIWRRSGSRPENKGIIFNIITNKNSRLEEYSLMINDILFGPVSEEFLSKDIEYYRDQKINDILK